jgi:hypothetical protein
MEEQRKNTPEENSEQAHKGQAHQEESQQGKRDQKEAKKQEEPLKKHGVPEDEEEGSRHGGLQGGANFRRNMGCGG